MTCSRSAMSFLQHYTTISILYMELSNGSLVFLNIFQSFSLDIGSFFSPFQFCPFT